MLPCVAAASKHHQAKTSNSSYLRVLGNTLQDFSQNPYTIARLLSAIHCNHVSAATGDYGGMQLVHQSHGDRVRHHRLVVAGGSPLSEMAWLSTGFCNALEQRSELWNEQSR